MTMTTYRRAGAKWTINECLKLQREFELLNLSVEEIAVLHERSPQAIMYKLDAEGFADYNELFRQQSQQYTSTLKDDDSEYQEDSDSDYEEDTDDDDAASEISEDEEDEEYDSYNIGQQVRLLTKQLSALTAFVMKTFKDRKSDIFKFDDLAGSR